jgi:hypothetical protein
MDRNSLDSVKGRGLLIHEVSLVVNSKGKVGNAAQKNTRTGQFYMSKKQKQ